MKLQIGAIIFVIITMIITGIVVSSCKKKSLCGSTSYLDSCVELCKNVTVVDDKIKCVTFCDEREASCRNE